MTWCSDAPEDEVISLFAGLLANPDMTLNRRHSDLTPDRLAFYTTTHALFPVLLPTSPTAQGFKKNLAVRE